MDKKLRIVTLCVMFFTAIVSGMGLTLFSVYNNIDVLIPMIIIGIATSIGSIFLFSSKHISE